MLSANRIQYDLNEDNELEYPSNFLPPELILKVVRYLHSDMQSLWCLMLACKTNENLVRFFMMKQITSGSSQFFVKFFEDYKKKKVKPYEIKAESIQFRLIRANDLETIQKEQVSFSYSDLTALDREG